MADVRTLLIPPGYIAAVNPRVSSYAAQLDDQLALLKKSVSGLDVAQLEWQPHSGVNTVGMLLAHLAIVDVWWITISPKGFGPGPETDEILGRIIGLDMNGDGLPCPPDGAHPATLKGKPLPYYLHMLDAARASTHDVLLTWQDSDLASTFVNHRGRTITRDWTAYHVLEHFSGHYGQILLLLHLMRDAGALAPSTA